MPRVWRTGPWRLAVLLAVLGLLTSSINAPPVAAQTAATLTGDIPNAGGVGLVVWSGGPVEQVYAVASAAGCDATSTWVSEGGELIGYVFGAPAFVNQAFLASPAGTLVAGAPLILVCRSGAPTPSAPPASLEAPLLSAYVPAAAQLAQYRIAVAARDAGDYDAATSQFGLVALGDGPMASVAAMRSAQMLLAADRDAEAAEAFATVLATASLPPALEVVTRLDAATALRSVDRGAEALPILAAVVPSRGASESQAARARWMAGEIRLALGDPAWRDDALAVVAAYPGTTSARQALDALEARGAAAPVLDAAYVRYRHGQDALARGLYQQVVAGAATGADAAVAWFYLGALAERAGDEDGAIDAYRRSLQFDPAGRLADDAHWWVGHVLTRAGRAPEAAEHWTTLATDFPLSSFASDAAVRAALTNVDLNAFDTAVAVLRQTLEVSSGSTAARAARWLQVLQSPAASPSAFDPRSLWAILEAAGPQATAPLPASALQEWPAGAASDWGEAAAWMQARFGPPPSGGIQGADVLSVAFGLALADEAPVARTVLRGHIDALEGRPYDLLALSRLAAEAGLHDISITAASRLLGALSPQQRLSAPDAIERLAYPLPFDDEILAAARAEGVPPLLLAALVRRESLFHPEAGSSAGAQGLAQIIPATGQEIAASLGVPWDPAMLLDPATSLRFGAHYLATQLRSFDGDVWGALAAYNGGPGNASRWFRQQPFEGAEWYIETVDFSETRLYLRVVIEDYAWYRYLYAGAAQPTMR